MPAQAVALQSDFAKGGVTHQAERAADPGCVLRLPRDAVQQGATGTWRSARGSRTGSETARRRYFSPLLDGRQYATGSTDYGDYNDPTVNKYIDAALTHRQPDRRRPRTGPTADDYVMTKDPAWIPLFNQALPQFIGSNVEHAIYVPFIGGFDPTNLWVK